MRHMIQALSAAVAVVAVLWLAACAPLRVHASLEPGVDFASFRSYAWAPASGFETGDPRLDNNELFEARLKADVEQALDARGLEKSTPATAAVLVHYHAAVSQTIDVNQLDQPYGYCPECRSSVYDAGTITIDIVDARANRLVWRGWSEGSLDGIDDQARIEARVDEAVGKIMQQLPQ